MPKTDVQVQGHCVYPEFLADSEFQAVGERELAKVRKISHSGEVGLATAALRSKQALAFQKLPGNGTGPDFDVQVFRVADPGDAMRVHPHLCALDGAQVRVGDVGLFAHVVQVCVGSPTRT
jgi:hypothetical protein